MKNKASVVLLASVLASLFYLAACTQQIELAKLADPSDDPLPPYKEMIKAALGRRQQIMDPEKYQPFAISGARRINSLHGWAWLVCLKGNHTGRPIYFGIFIQHQEIIDVRANIGIDLCPYQQYEPLSVSSPAMHQLY